MTTNKARDAAADEFAKEHDEFIAGSAIGGFKAGWNARDEEVKRLLAVRDIAEEIIEMWYRKPPREEGGDFLAALYRLKMALREHEEKA